MANVAGVSPGSVNDSEVEPLSVREQAVRIARSGDLIGAQEFLLQNPTARTVLENEMLRGGQHWMINALASSSAMPTQVAQQGAVAAPAGGFSFPEISPADLARAASILRSGSLLGAGMTAAEALTSTPPQPTGVRVADDITMVFNNQRYTHDFLVRGNDSMWRYAQNDGQLVRATGSPDGLLVVDLQALSRAYGGPLPNHIVNMTTIGTEALQGTSVLESRARPAGVPANLQTTSASARAALGLQTGNMMQAHHLIPANVWGNPAFSPFFATAQTVGWNPDVGNTIALPSDAATQARLAAVGINLPIHSGSHRNYDAQVTAKLTAAFATLPANVTPPQIRAVIDTVAASMVTEIQAGLWHPKVH